MVIKAAASAEGPAVDTAALTADGLKSFNAWPLLIFPVSAMLGYTFISLILNRVQQPLGVRLVLPSMPDSSQITGSIQCFYPRAISKPIASA